MIAAWIFLALALLSGAAAQKLALGSYGRDTGPFWAAVLDRLALFVGIPFLLLAIFSTLPSLKPLLPSASIWLLILGVAWLLLLGLGIFRPSDPESARWLAGTLQFSPHRAWVLILGVPLLPALFFLWPSPVDDIQAGNWGLPLLFFVALIGLAISASPMSAWLGEQRLQAAHSSDLSPWPEEMKSRGVDLQLLSRWTTSPPAAPAVGLAALWQQRLSAAGASGVPAVLCEAVSKLMNAVQRQDERVSIVLGPDFCGQEEILALAATEIARRFGETTLIVTARQDPAFVDRMTFWLSKFGLESPAKMLALNGRRAVGPRDPDLVVTDAETLSDSALDQLRGELEGNNNFAAYGIGLARVGLVVWWNAHKFSGVEAAHVWAVSRRLERLLQTRRGSPARALVFARSPRRQEAAFLGFLAHLLPYKQTASNRYPIPSNFVREVNLHRLTDSAESTIRDAVTASRMTEWSTFADDRAHPTTAEIPLALSPATAGACILEVRPDEVLSLREIICQVGRAGETGREHHVAVAPSDNPYASFLLRRAAADDDETASINLISAGGQEKLIQRHLLLGLREVPDTLSGLRANFRWEEERLRRTLDRLSQENRLRQTPVRFLNSDKRLQRDFLYENENPGQGAIHSFRMMGQTPVELRDPNVTDLRLLQVDPERLPIDAYPQRVFRSTDKWYRVQEWSLEAGGVAPARINCANVEAGVRNWPFSTMRVSAIESQGGELQSPGLIRYPATVQYHEDVAGLLEQSQDGQFNSIKFPTVRTSFRTEALILEFTSAGLFTPDLLVGAAATLQYILEVHIAVEEGTLRVVRISDGPGNRLAIVDLYPGGIGLVDAIHSSPWLMPRIFDKAVEWLESFSRQEEMDAVAKSPLYRTRNLTRFDAPRLRSIFVSARMEQR